MRPEEQAGEFVRRACAAAETNLQSVVLYGSAVAGGFHPALSDVNLFCVLREITLPALEALAPAVKWWERQKQPPPVLMTREELSHAAEVFAIELLDMQRQHRVLYGDDVIAGLRISTELHRAQVEYELREKLLLLRQQLLLAAPNGSQIWKLLMHSLPSIVTLFRHAGIALGSEAVQTEPGGAIRTEKPADGAARDKREAIAALEQKASLDAAVVHELLAAREQKSNPKETDVRATCGRYLRAIEQVIAAIERVKPGFPRGG